MNFQTNSNTNFPKLGGTISDFLCAGAAHFEQSGIVGCIAVVFNSNQNSLHLGNAMNPRLEIEDFAGGFRELAAAVLSGGFDRQLNQAKTAATHLAQCTDSEFALIITLRGDGTVCFAVNQRTPKEIVAVICGSLADGHAFQN